MPKSRLSASGYPVYGAAGQIGFYEKYTHNKPTITLACRGTACGTITVVPAYSCISGNTMALDDLDEGRALPDYVVDFLRYRGLSDVISGSAQPQITKQALLRVSIPLPALSKQRELIRVTQSVEQVQKATTELIEHLERVKKSAAVYLFTRGLPGMHKAFQPCEAGEIPAAWTMCKLSERAVVDTGFAFKSDDFCDPGPDTVPVVRIGDLRRGKINVQGSEHVHQGKVAGLERFALKAGDILVGLSGSVGHVARVRKKDLPAYLNQRVGRIRLNSGDPRFVENWYRGPFVQQYVRDRSAGAVQSNLSPAQVREIPVPMAGADEEHRIADFFDCIDERLAVEREALVLLDGLQRQVLSQFFNSLTP